ncbi:MAG: VCBS repeat-containing protein [Planctomycetota bacterium]
MATWTSRVVGWRSCSGRSSRPNGRRTIVDVFAFPDQLLTVGLTDLLQAIDLDADGDLDLLAVDRPTGPQPAFVEVVLYDNDGTGSFTRNQALSGPLTNLVQILPIQNDGSGSPELLRYISFTGFQILTRNANGTYSTTSVPSLPSSLTDDPRFTVLDIDGDGLDDVAVIERNGLGTAGGTLRVFRNTGGSFAQIGLSATISDVVFGIDALDVEGDGALDLAVQTLSGVRLYGNDGSGVMSLRQTIPTAFNPFTVGLREVGDLDADGRDDLLLAAGPNVAIGFGQPDGTISAPRAPFFDRADLRQLYDDQILAGDIDGDGRTDLYASGNSIGLAIQRGTGDYLVTSASAPPRLAFESVVADTDGDGQTELYQIDRASTIRLADGSGRISTSSLQTALDPDDLTCIDADGDGDDEILGLDPLTAGIFALLVPDPANILAVDPSAFPGPVNPSGVTTTPNRIVVLDVDDDGDQDFLAYANVVTLNTQVGYTMINDGSGVFSLGITLPVMGIGTNPPSSFVLGDPAVGDLDGDGDIDLAFPGLQTQLLNDGSGNFTVGPGGIPSPPSELYLAVDLDVDGVNEIVSWSSDSPSELYILCNNGAGAFVPANIPVVALDQAVEIPMNSAVHKAFTLADLDDDGDQDLIAGANVLLSTAAQLRLNAPLRVGERTAWTWSVPNRPIEDLGETAVALESLLISTTPLATTLPLDLGALALNAPISIATGIRILASPLPALGFIPLNVPSTPALAGVEIYSQGAAIDVELGGPGLAVGATNVIRSVISF